jgi:hypothetical protein
MSVTVTPQELDEATRGNDFSFTVTASVLQPEDSPLLDITILNVDAEIEGGLNDSLFENEDIYEFSGVKIPYIEDTTFEDIVPKDEEGNDTESLITLTLKAKSLEYNNNSVAVTVHVPGTGYIKNNILKILGTDIGGQSPENDLTIKIKKVFADYQAESNATSVVLTGKHLAGFTDNLSYVKKGSSDKQEDPVIAVGVENLPKVKEMFKLTNQDLTDSIDRQFKIIVEYRERQAGVTKYKKQTFVLTQKVKNTLEAMKNFIGEYFPKD